MSDDHADKQPAPTMLTRPADSPEPLSPLVSKSELVSLHAEWERVHASPQRPSVPSVRGARRKARSLANRALGRSDHELIGDLIRAVNAVAVRCDELSARLAEQGTVVEEVTTVLSEEVTRMRSAVERLIARGPHE